MWSKLVFVLLASLACTLSVVTAGFPADAVLGRLQAALSSRFNDPLPLPDYQIKVQTDGFWGTFALKSCQLTNLQDIARSGDEHVETFVRYKYITVETNIENVQVDCKFESATCPTPNQNGTLRLSSPLDGHLEFRVDLKTSIAEYQSFFLRSPSPTSIILSPLIHADLQDLLKEEITKKYQTDILTYAQNVVRTEVNKVLN